MSDFRPIIDELSNPDSNQQTLSFTSTYLMEPPILATSEPQKNISGSTTYIDASTPSHSKSLENGTFLKAASPPPVNLTETTLSVVPLATQKTTDLETPKEVSLSEHKLNLSDVFLPVGSISSQISSSGPSIFSSVSNQGATSEIGIFSGISLPASSSESFIFTQSSLPDPISASGTFTFPQSTLPAPAATPEPFIFSQNSLSAPTATPEPFMFPQSSLPEQGDDGFSKYASLLNFSSSGATFNETDSAAGSNHFRDTSFASDSLNSRNQTNDNATSNLMPVVDAALEDMARFKDSLTFNAQGEMIITGGSTVCDPAENTQEAAQVDLSQEAGTNVNDSNNSQVTQKGQENLEDTQPGHNSITPSESNAELDAKPTEVKERKRTKRKRVSEELRGLIHAHAMDNLSNKEIAMALRLPRQTVYSILNPKVPPPTDENCPRTDKRFNKDRDAIQDRILFYVQINPDFKTRDIQRLLGGEGYFISEKSVASWRKGLVLAVQILGVNKCTQVVAHDAAVMFLQGFTGDDSGTLDSGVIYVSHHCIKASLRDFGPTELLRKKPQASESKIGTQGAFFSIFLAVTGEGILFSDSVRFIAPTPSVDDSIRKFMQIPSLGVPGRKIVLSSCFESQKIFYELAAARGHTVVTMPANMAYSHLGEAIFYNLPRHIRSMKPQTREKVAEILDYNASFFPKEEIRALFQKCRAALFGATLAPGHRLPPGRGVIPTPITPPSKEAYQEMFVSFKHTNIQHCLPELKCVLQEYTDMLF